MIKETIPLLIKKYHVQGGDAGVFGQDAAERRVMKDAEWMARFADVWSRCLEPELAAGKKISYSQAKEILDPKYHQYLLPRHEHRQFLVQSVPFLAQIDPEGVCNQLWSVGKHRDPTRLSVHFRSIEVRGRFDNITARLGWDSDKLAKKILYDFITTVDGAADSGHSNNL